MVLDAERVLIGATGLILGAIVCAEVVLRAWRHFVRAMRETGEGK